MITVKDIHTRVVEILKEQGHLVIATEIQEGFPRPAFFVSALPNTATLQACSGASEEITDTVEIRYYSVNETMEELVDAVQELKELFLYQPLRLNGRAFTVHTLEFDVEDNVLSCTFDLTFTQYIERDDEFTPIEDIYIGGI